LSKVRVNAIKNLLQELKDDEVYLPPFLGQVLDIFRGSGAFFRFYIIIKI